MTTKFILRHHPATPEEAIEFANHLFSAYPVTTRRQIAIEFRSGNSAGRNAWGRAYDYTVNNTIYLDIVLGTAKERRPLPDLLRTIGHEYCHALQYDQGKPADCEEANKFGIKESQAFLKRIERRVRKAA